MHFSPTPRAHVMCARGVVRGIGVAIRATRVGRSVPDNNNRDVEHAVERYLAAHPNAADSADGVRRWWLADPSIPLADIEAALEALVTRGLLDVRWLLDGTAIYFSRGARDGRDG